MLRNVIFEYTTHLKNAKFSGATMDKLTYALLQGMDVDLEQVVVE